jgi:precorrin-6Y C5,15-methyltransferase (decarboxylating)
LGQVYAVERSAERVALIHQNLAKFGTRNVLVIQDIAPAALEGLPGPDAVFVGGSGGQLSGILDVVSRRLNAGGRVVVNAATLETAGVAMAGLRERDFATEVTLMQVSRGRELGGLTHLEALDPVFVIAARRNRSGAEVGW